MKTRLASSLTVPLNSITDQERIGVEKWLQNLKGSHIDGALTFIEKTYSFFKTHRVPHSFVIMNAVGSTVMGKENYDDIDFMLLTDGKLEQYEEKASQGPRFGGLADAILPTLSDALLPEYHACMAMTDLTEIYNENPARLPGRSVLNITPSEGIYHPWDKIHLILQRNVPSEEEWDKKDTYERVPIFRIR